MNDRLKWRMWSTHAGRYFDENNDAMLENVFECMKQQICYDCQNPILRKIYNRIAYNHIENGMVFEQCTGLKDKNGKLIYEGDILTDGANTFIVNWYDDMALFRLLYKNDNRETYCLFYPDDAASKYTVIGNIHEETEK